MVSQPGRPNLWGRCVCGVCKGGEGEGGQKEGGVGKGVGGGRKGNGGRCGESKVKGEPTSTGNKRCGEGEIGGVVKGGKEEEKGVKWFGGMNWGMGSELDLSWILACLAWNNNNNNNNNVMNVLQSRQCL